MYHVLDSFVIFKILFRFQKKKIINHSDNNILLCDRTNEYTQEKFPFISTALL